MKTSKPVLGRYLGYRDKDRVEPYAHYFTPDLSPIANHVCAALDRGGVPDILLPDIELAAKNLFGDEAVLENGFVLTRDGGMRVSVRTEMPGVTPAMVDWWFGWHGDSAAKYKLWHPQAHIHAEWREPLRNEADIHRPYLGRTSIVDEYIGSDLIRGSIRFLAPTELGLSDRSLDVGSSATIICARIGLGDMPIDVGYLAHHVRTVPGGSEMRSRFWMGGRHVGGRNPLGTMASVIAKRFLRISEGDARALIVHCAQEMPHLAHILPALHDEFRGRNPNCLPKVFP